MRCMVERTGMSENFRGNFLMNASPSETDIWALFELEMIIREEVGVCFFATVLFSLVKMNENKEKFFV